MTNLNEFLSMSKVDNSIFDLRPDYRAGILIVDGLRPMKSNEFSNRLLVTAEQKALELIGENSVEFLPHIAQWRETFLAFGAKPQRTRNSLEALTRRAVQGLPRVNLLTDIYNAISVIHQIPLGGEDLEKYQGVPHLTRASGEEFFDTLVEGELVIENPDPGEVVWRDDQGVTCRRWNWRQGVRTRLTDETKTAIFILDALSVVSNADLESTMAQLVEQISELCGAVNFSTRVIKAPD